jgi:prepilin-type N-terminal cleavage/methylation domain-containing protein
MNIGNDKGFTLVEIAIVLVIVGLLIGGVLKGREMITNAKIKRIERDHAGIIAAMQAYRDRYLILPGDDNRASARFGLYTDGVNDPAAADIDGDASGIVDGAWEAAANTETGNFWKHLRAANLIPGGGDDDTQPTNAYGGNIGLRDGSLNISGHVIIFGSVEGPIASILESQLDDGSPSTGLIQSDVTSALMDGNAVSTAGANYLDSQRYFMAFDI